MKINVLPKWKIEEVKNRVPSFQWKGRGPEGLFDIDIVVRGFIWSFGLALPPGSLEQREEGHNSDSSK